MAKYVPDIQSRRWVIISTKRSSRPENTDEDHKAHTKKTGCPFCPGGEKGTPPEVFRIGKGAKDEKGWEVRVVANKYPITDLHEVIIHSPHCDKDIENLPLSHVEMILKAYRERFNFYRKNGQVLIFCNHGEHAGASLSHPHSQLVVLPWQINLDTLVREPLNNVVDNNKFYNVYCPEFSQWPYEAWVVPKKEGGFFGDINDLELGDLAQIIQKIIKQLEMIHKKNKIFHLPFGYNFYIYPKENWYMRIIPRFVHRAGFELGTGLSVNVIDPYQASLELKGVGLEVMGVLKKLKSY
ncbi:DUF4931 domain-containing protein [Candidatus Roizmanbacteria bacterium]|nr:DUF4931 domain-containing protein [Candidatus Roizmanbacteria bacterium]